ncbi:MAG: hypothetical protein AAGH89_05375, partial [Verrucomicrobiota bacterium]
MKKKTFTIGILIVAGMAATTQAADITWSAQSLTGAGNVSTNGVLLEALNFNGGDVAANHDTTINGVLFEGFVNGALNNNQFPNPTATYFSATSDNVVGSGADWYSVAGGGLAEYDLLLSRSLWGNELITTLSNLVIGQAYEVQLFFGDTRSDGVVYILIDNGTADQFGNPELTPFRSASDPADNGLAITGTFVATGTTQSFTIANLNDAPNPYRLSAYQLREIDQIPPPEIAAGDRVLIDFGANDQTTGIDSNFLHWNNVSDSRLNTAQTGLTVLDTSGNLINSLGNDSGATFSAARVGDAQNVQIGGTAVDRTGALRSNPAGTTYDLTAYRDSLFVADNGNATRDFYQVTISGLNNSLTYNFTFLSQFGGGAGNGNIYAELAAGSTPDEYTVEAGLSDEYSFVQSWFELTNVSPDSGEVVINFYSDNQNNGRLNTMEISAAPPAPVTYHVATDGNDGNSGNEAAPFRNINKAAAVMKAGDTCLIHAGRYYERVVKGGLAGSASRPITFKPYGDGPVVIDGTVAISNIQTSGWTEVTHNGVSMYKTTVDTDFWQLFDDGEVATVGRWPNASYADGKLWDRNEWAWSAASSTNGNLVTDNGGSKPDLAATGLGFQGGYIIHNCGQWNTRISKNYTHVAGSGTIAYPNFGNFRGDEGSHRYFLTAHLNCVDVAGEWHYNNPTNEVYFKTLDGAVPSGDIRGRIRRWGFDLNDCSHVKVQGIEFFGCSIEITASIDFHMEDCKFEHFNVQKRVLGSGEWSIPHFEGPRTTIRNCTFAYADGRGLNFAGAENSVVENVLLHDVDWTGGGSSTVVMNGSENVRVTRFTMYNTGASEGLGMGPANITEFCRVGPDVGALQEDGSPIHFHPWAHENSIMRYCWTYDHEKRGARADVNNGVNNGNGDFQGSNFLMHHMVAWDVGEGGLSLAGDFQEIYNNTSFNNNRPDIYMIKKGTYLHANTITRNNATDPRGISDAYNRFAGSVPPPGTASNNWDASNVRHELIDPSNFDFRPKPDSPLIDVAMNIAGITDGYVGSAPDVGAYEYGDENYWIPGFQTAQASMAIPSDGTTNQAGDRDLIWLGGWEGTSYDVYFGTDSAAVASAAHGSSEFQGNQQNNIFKPLAVSNSTCYWRIDTVTPEGTMKGGTWQLTYSALQDQDNDDLYDYWEERFFGGTAASAGGLTDDFDKDGMSDLHELRAGTDPTDPGSLLIVSSVEMESEAEMTISWQSAPNQVYT